MLIRALAVCTVLATVVVAGGRDYGTKEKVPVLVNTVGPFHNPAEVYKYYSLPYCQPDNVASPGANLGQDLTGDRRRTSKYEVRFLIDVQWAPICSLVLSQNQIRQFVDAVREDYVFEMFVDDLPVTGFVGEIEHTSLKFDQHVHNETFVYLFTHLDFSIAYNGPNIIAVNLTTDPQQRVELAFGKDIKVEFSYSVSWVPTNVPWVDRMSLHRASIADQAIEIHWLSIINSFVLVVLLTAFLALILLRVLKRDFQRYMHLDDDEGASLEEQQEEVGWKLVHGDVFRPPPYKMLLSAMIGTGSQMLILILSLLLLSLVWSWYPTTPRGSLYTAAILLYALTAWVAGFVGTTVYVQLGGDKWATNAMLIAFLFAGPVFLTFAFVNSVAIYYGSSTAVPFAAIFVIACLWALVTLPLTVLGSSRAKSQAPQFHAPCKTNRAPREIPPAPWHRRPAFQLLMSGFLPFSAIYIELHYIFSSIYGHHTYTLFGILILAFLLLIIVSAFITIAVTYFQLTSEDYRWWWRSLLSGASTGIFMYAYAAFYYHFRSEMTGFLQGAFFFGYVLMASYAFALMLGAVGYYCAQRFVRHIYSSIKVD